MSERTNPEDKTDVDLGEVQETLLIPLYGRAKDAASRKSVLGDVKAREIVDSIDYDFAKFRGTSLSGSVLRSSIFDGWVREFLAENPTGTVVEIGCGLNTRFERLDNGRMRWFDLDVPDTAKMWRRFFSESDRRSLLPVSVFDTEWMDKVAETGGPWVFVAEAIFLYFPPDEVGAVLEKLCTRFPGSLLLLDSGNTAMSAGMHKNAAMKRVTARMKWTCEDPREIENWGPKLLETRTFASPQPEVLRTWPRAYRYGMRAVGKLLPPMVNLYRMNKLRLPER